MFKRLSKSRRHSADDVALSLSSSVVPLDELSATSMPRTKSQDLESATLLKISRTKYTRRSCGDAGAMQTLLETKQDNEQDVIEADYQTVTAVPAFIVEHDPSKQRVLGLGIWGRRMGKKIDSFRRTRSRETICSITERPDSVQHNINNNNNNNINNNDTSTSNNNIDVHQLSKIHLDERTNRKLPAVCQRSPSPFKSFFIRMGSTGMLNSTKSNRRSQNIEERTMPDKESLFRSCSTSQLNNSPTYVKGDDPSEGIDLQIAARKDKTVSCDNLAGHQGNDHEIFEARALDCTSTYSLGSPSVSFSTCDLEKTKNDSFMRKSSSCDLKEAKKSNFPYAFLRSKLSVLPEERHGSLVSKDERLFKTVSEEHFPTLQIEDSYINTTTLGRKRSRIGNVSNYSLDATRNQENISRLGRISYAEFQRNSRYEADRYSLNASRLERIEAGLQREGNAGCYSLFDGSLLSLRENNEFRHSEDTTRDKTDFAVGRIETGIMENCNVDLDMMTAIRSNRRNSVSSCEQRLSSHYVSSNESGYDSDGPRGESVAALENEGLKCSSDTSSVVDSEADKPIRSSTPSECQDQENVQIAGRIRQNSDIDENRPDAISRMNFEGIDGLRWHQSGSGRMLPSIHGTSFEEEAVSRLEDTPLPSCEDRLNLPDTAKALDVSSHRARLQQDKTRFLSDIIQPLTRVRRCCLIQLHKRDPKDSLGIRLAQQRLGDLRYIVVQLESDGIAHRDGRLRLGDEIVEVEGKELKTLETLEEVQEFLKSFTGNTVRLTTAYEETVPQVYENPPLTVPGEYEYLENAKNLSSMSLIDTEANHVSSSVEKKKKKKTTDGDAELLQSRKRPDFLPLLCLSESQKDIRSSVESAAESQHYLTRHVAKFEKGYGKPSLGFSVVGGRDSPRGDMGIFVRRVFPGGQADISKSLFQGDEILSLNRQILKGRTHQEVIELFKTVREGIVELEVTRRHRYPKSTVKTITAPY